MSSRTDILENLRRHTHQKYDMPDMSLLHGVTFSNPLEHFRETLQSVGGESVILEKGQDINLIIREKFPDAQQIASEMEEINIANINPKHLDSPHELNNTDLGIVRGALGVAENGSIWLPQDVTHRAIYFISEFLVIVLNKNRIVSNMHEAYKQISFSDKGYGVFISGPSKTADIEQALVIGAHGARGLLVVLT